MKISKNLKEQDQDCERDASSQSSLAPVLSEDTELHNKAWRYRAVRSLYGVKDVVCVR